MNTLNVAQVFESYMGEGPLPVTMYKLQEKQSLYDWESALGLQLTSVTRGVRLPYHASISANHVFKLSLNDSM